MSDFIYAGALAEFKKYLDSNLKETVYFDAMRLKKAFREDDLLVYKEVIRNEKFSMNQVLDEERNRLFVGQIRKYHKVNSYRDYCYTAVHKIRIKSDFDDRINAIQAICGINHIAYGRHFFHETSKDTDHLPISVKLPYWSFNMLHSPHPYDTLHDLLGSMSGNDELQNLYFNFVRFYFSPDVVGDLLKKAVVETDNNHIALLVAILYIYSVKDIPFELGLKMNKSTFKIFRQTIPSELEEQYGLLNDIEASFALTSV